MERRLRPAAHGVAIAFLCIALATLLNARGLRKTAVGQPAGIRRDAAMALTAPLVRVSHFLYLDRPRQELKGAIGRGADDRVDTTIELPGVPIATSPPSTTVARPAPPAPAPPPRPAATVPAKPPPKPKPRPKPPKRPALPAFNPAHPLRVWVAGDSLVAVPGQSLERATGSGGSIRVLSVEFRVATGFTRPDVYNWFTRIREALAELHPKVVVLSFGSNDDHDYMASLPEGRSIGPLGSTTWVAEYRRRIAGVTQELAAAGVYVVWLGLPITRGEGRNKGFRVINRVLKDVAASFRKNAYYLDTYRMFQNRRGRYADYLPNGHGRLVLMRASDGVHYQPAAGDLIARAVLRKLSTLYDPSSRTRR